MKVVVQAGELARALSHVRGVVPARATMPILMHVLVRAAGDRIEVRGSDLEKEASISVAATVEAEGSVALPGDILLGVAKRLEKSRPVTITTGGEADDRDVARVASGSSRYKLRTMPADEFPAMPELDGPVSFAIAAVTLAEMLKSSFYACGTMESQSFLQGVFLHLHDDKIAAVATDTHRLGMMEVASPEAARGMPGVTLPRDAVREIISMLDAAEGEVDLAVAPNLVRVRAGAAEVTTKLIGTPFPQFRTLIPKDRPSIATFRPGEMAEAVDRAFAVYIGADVKAPRMILRAAEAHVSLATAVDRGDAGREDVAAEVHVPGAQVQVMAKYLAEMLKMLPADAVDIRPSEIPEAGPILFTAAGRPDLLHLIMPQR